MPFGVDSMFAALLAMDGAAKNGIPTDKIRSGLLKDEMYKLAFQGVTGPVAFDKNGDRLGDYEIYNHVKVGEEVKVEIVGLWGTTGVKFDKQLTFPDGTTTPTPQRFPKCPPGKFGPGVPNCEDCPPGTANKVPGAQACIPCNRGFYSDSGGALQCKMCPAGTEQPREGQTICTACSPGFFGELRGQPECAPCVSGSFSGAAATKCSKCPVATYADERSMTACKPCLDTFTTDVPGAEEVGECTCAQGTYWDRLHDVCQQCQPESFWAAIQHEIAAGQTWTGRISSRSKSGEALPVEVTVCPIRADDGDVTHVVSVRRDIREALRAEEMLKAAALHDPLTGLPNRTLFYDRLDQAMRRAERRDAPEVAVLFVDLDGYRALLETFGRQSAERILQVLAPRMRAVLRPEDTLSRLGGDEFAVILTEATVEDADAVAERLLGR
ncbi:MAG TPA: diguanylate cyclase, partial [Candidatus Handelsmanbacteria bacterium]|nr:diguanylate cyclase [Candidatus Handelsmanbacteria bacterium]